MILRHEILGWICSCAYIICMQLISIFNILLNPKPFLHFLYSILSKLNQLQGGNISICSIWFYFHFAPFRSFVDIYLKHDKQRNPTILHWYPQYAWNYHIRWGLPESCKRLFMFVEWSLLNFMIHYEARPNIFGRYHTVQLWKTPPTPNHQLYLEDHPRACKWLATLIYEPFRPFGRGTTNPTWGTY